MPIIPSIHQTVFAAASRPDALNMDTWHTCDTIHCRAGWVVHLAGDEGRKLEEAMGTPLAAAKIYKTSSKLPVAWAIRFYETDAEAMADMERMAKLEMEEK